MDRPCPVVRRPDLLVRAAHFQGEACWLVKNPLALHYHRLHPAQYHLLTLCDGGRTPAQLRAGFSQAFPMQRLSEHDLQSLLADFLRQGLAMADRPGQARALLRRAGEHRLAALGRALANPLFIRIPGWNATRLLGLLQSSVGWMFRPAGLVLGCLVILGSWLLLAIHLGELSRDLTVLRQHFGWSNVAWLWITLAVAKVLHELGHGVCCRELGGECHEIGMAFMVFSPSLYCDVSDSWMLPSKWRRIAIGAAGMYVELLIAGVALAIWVATTPGTLHQLALNTFCVTTLTTILFNANPLLQYDGYYIASDLLEIPNLRSRAERLLQRWGAGMMLGLRLPADPFAPAGGQFGLILYALAASVYRWGMMFSLAFILHDTLRPLGLAVVGAWWGLGTGAFALVHFGRSVFKTVRSAGSESMSPWRVAGTAMLAGIIGTALLAIPFPCRRELPVVFESRRAAPVFAAVSGRLRTQHVAAGDPVEAGDTLLELENFEQADQLRRLRTTRDLQQIELAVQRKLNQAAGMRLAAELLERLEEQIAELEAQQQRLVIVAPCAGRVVAPPTRGASRAGTADLAAGWSGTPLDAANVGAWIETGTQLLSIAPDGQFEGRGYLEQPLRNDLAGRDAVFLKADSTPATLSPGTLTSVSERHVETIPDTLSNKFGGPLATLVDPQGRERLPSAAFEARLELPVDMPPLLCGMRGRARYFSRPRTAAQWAWRWLRVTLQFGT